MITSEQYFLDPHTGRPKPHTPEQEEAAADLLHRREALRAEFEQATGLKPLSDPDTNCEISGRKGGDGDGGFRMPRATTGKGNSSHKEAKGVDDYDPYDDLDDWLTLYDRDNGVRNEVLERHGLYREHPDSTPGWCHLTTRPPKSGKRTFQP